MEAMSDEEKLLYQKSKIKWLSYGDKNNAFFHKILKGRYQRNRISVIHNDMGQRFKGNQVASQFVDHFTKFLGLNVLVSPIPDDDLMFKRRLSMLEDGNMVKEVTSKEIKDAMFSMGDNKAPGPDELNANIISLIPKMQTPLKLSDFGSITCCNVSAFIPGRQIQDNILLAQELMKGYDRSGGAKRVAFKIDIQKAYDIINWDFLEQLLRKFGFHEKMIQWIVLCIRSVKFSINVNGENCGFFKRGRGLRQGDPMSPYLFTMVMEFFTLTMERNVENTPEFNYHFSCRRLKVTHICFADDLLVFFHGDPSSVRLIKSSLEEFGSHSGLVPNFSKSTVFFRSINNEDQQCLLDILPFQKGSLPMRYLGVPLITKRLVVKEINSILKAFLWSSGEVSKGKAKIAWKNVCKQKIHGGLGLKDLIYCNKALLIKHIWNIANKKDNLWVKWVNTVKLKDLSIWMVQKEAINSWGWKNLLDIRDLIVLKIQAVIDRNYSVSDMIVNGSWKWPRDWYDLFPFLSNIIIPNLIQGKEDSIVWMDNGVCHKQFCTKVVYDSLRSMIGTEWKEIMDSLAAMDTKRSIGNIIRKLCLGASVYFIWTRMMGLKVKRSNAVCLTAAKWNVKMNFKVWPWEETGSGWIMYIEWALLVYSNTPLLEACLGLRDGGCSLSSDAKPSLSSDLISEV
ncbi:RNA-directed DNA polymerase, eukaryota, reverse transcriptase zinc-binding domain protein [Tanacetum coccineum]